MRNRNTGLPFADECDQAELADRGARIVVLLVSALFFLIAVAVLVSAIHSAK